MMIVLSYSSYKNGIISNFWWFPILKWPQEFRSKLTISYFWYFWAFDHIPKFLFFAIFRIFHIFCEIGQKMMRSFEDRMRFYSELIGIFDRIRISWISGRRFCYWENIIISGYNLSRLSDGTFLSLKPVSSASKTLNQLSWLPPRLLLLPKKVFLSQKRYFEDWKTVKLEVKVLKTQF